jgi:FkbM family methyltransferase
MKNMCAEIQKNIDEADKSRIQIMNYAVRNKKEAIYFTEDGSRSHIDNNSKDGVRLNGIDIDSVVDQDKVTFIKMDAEGSEKKALEGAKNTIIRDHPTCYMYISQADRFHRTCVLYIRACS